jgi:hypothetical protein
MKRKADCGDSAAKGVPNSDEVCHFKLENIDTNCLVQDWEVSLNKSVKQVLEFSVFSYYIWYRNNRLAKFRAIPTKYLLQRLLLMIPMKQPRFDFFLFFLVI